MEYGKVYFWTATINGWQHLLKNDVFKNIIIHSLTYLVAQKKITVYAFIIMPNHVHFIWQINDVNGKETPQTSFLKYTAHEFKKILQQSGGLEKYKVIAPNKQYEFWQRDALAIWLFDKKIAMQKLHYIHQNPLAEHWQLVKDPCDYYYSSAKYYEQDEKNFSFLDDLHEVF
jgi:REP element-mobilizing transposase RayT